MQSQPTEHVERFVLLLGGLALALLAANTYAVGVVLEPTGWWMIGAALLFLVGFVVLERLSVTFLWRGHRVSTALTEVAVLLGYIALSPYLVVLLAPLARIFVHFAARRPPLKGIFNTAQVIVAAAIGAAAFVGASVLGAPDVLAGVLAAVAYSVASEGIVASLFAVMERANLARVYRERFALPNALALAIGVPGGLAVYALYMVHPLATLAAVPVFALLVRHAALQASVDRELLFRRRLADDASALVGSQDDAQSLARLFATTRELLDAGRVRLVRVDGSVFEDEDDHATAPANAPQLQPLAAPIVGRHGELLGTLEAWPRPMKRPFGEEESALLQIIASQAAFAFESTRALAEVAAQRDLIARQEKLSALGTLLAGIAHELNNPLSFMHMRVVASRKAAQKALESTEPIDGREFARQMASHLDVFARGVERLRTLSESLKATARPGDGARRPTNVNDVAREVLNIVQVVSKEVRFDVALDPNLPEVPANASEINQVMLNLLKNATEALSGRSDGRVHLVTRLAGERVEVRVEDNGPGIPSDVRERLFAPFFTTKKHGTGLGLNISHKIAKSHGGSLTVEETPGGGTTFVLALPLVAPEPAPAPTPV